MADRSKLDPRIADNYKAKRTKGDRVTIAIICPEHGFMETNHCSICDKRPKDTLHINTSEWVKGYWDSLDSEPIYIDSKEHLIHECEKRGVYPKSLMKPKSQGKGYEMRRR